MSFSIGEITNKLIDRILTSPTIHNIASNPVYTAILITIIVMLIVMIIIHDEISESMLICVRVGFWVFFMITGVLLLYTKVLDHDNKVGQSHIYGNYENLFGDDGVYDPIMVPNAVPIEIPNYHLQ